MLVYLSLAADLLMVAASLGAAVYCLVLSRRLSRLTSFDKGIGGAIAVMSQQVDEMRAALAEARTGTDGAGQHLQTLVSQAREISGELELMIAACHDFAEEAIAVQTPPQAGGVQAGVPDTVATPAAPHPDAPPPDALPPPAAAVAMPVFGSRRAATVAAARA